MRKRGSEESSRGGGERKGEWDGYRRCDLVDFLISFSFWVYEYFEFMSFRV